MYIPTNTIRKRAGENPLFEAELRPHRSLSPEGFWLLMAIISAVCFTAGLAFLFVGAWPVFGFLGLDVTLLYLAFRLNYRSGRLVETICLNDRELVIKRCLPNGQIREWRLIPYWVRVSLETPLRHNSQLVLSTHGRHIKLGSFLTLEERQEIAEALRTALLGENSLENSARIGR